MPQSWTSTHNDLLTELGLGLELLIGHSGPTVFCYILQFLINKLMCYFIIEDFII